LFLLYPLDYLAVIESAKKAVVNEPPPKPLVGFAVSFPADATGTRVRYRVNNVYWNQEYGGPV
jgi:hypothetical protein